MLNLPAVTADDFRVENGRVVFGHDPTRWLPFHEVSAKMGNYMIVGHGARGPNPDGKAINTFGAHFCEVEVNVETGQVRVNRVVAAHEIGRVVNPLTATSQVYGGVIMALGYGATEERVLDGRTGLQLTANLEAYRLPTMGDVPHIEVLFVARPTLRPTAWGARAWASRRSSPWPQRWPTPWPMPSACG